LRIRSTDQRGIVTATACRPAHAHGGIMIDMATNCLLGPNQFLARLQDFARRAHHDPNRDPPGDHATTLPSPAMNARLLIR